MFKLVKDDDSYRCGRVGVKEASNYPFCFGVPDTKGLVSFAVRRHGWDHVDIRKVNNKVWILVFLWMLGERKVHQRS